MNLKGLSILVFCILIQNLNSYAQSNEIELSKKHSFLERLTLPLKLKHMKERRILNRVNVFSVKYKLRIFFLF